MEEGRWVDATVLSFSESILLVFAMENYLAVGTNRYEVWCTGIFHHFYDHCNVQKRL